MVHIVSNKETEIFQTWLFKHRSAEIKAKLQQAIQNWEPGDSDWDYDDVVHEVPDVEEVLMDIVADVPTPEFMDGTLRNCRVSSNDESFAAEVLRPLLQLAARRIEPGCVAAAFLEAHKELKELVAGRGPNTGPDRRSIHLE